MARAHSRCTSCAAPRCPPRITVVVIRSAAKAAVSQARTSSRQVLVFLTDFQEYGTKNITQLTAISDVLSFQSRTYQNKKESHV